MDQRFLAHVNALRPKLDALLKLVPCTRATLPRTSPRAGIYLLSEEDTHLYVGRSNNIRSRLGRHCLPGATHRMAAFAFRLAREATGQLRATYKKGEGSRAALMENPQFLEAFVNAKQRISKMNVRYVEEADPTRQALLEIYAAVVLETRYNDFDTH